MFDSYCLDPVISHRVCHGLGVGKPAQGWTEWRHLESRPSWLCALAQRVVFFGAFNRKIMGNLWKSMTFNRKIMGKSKNHWESMEIYEHHGQLMVIFERK